MTAGMKAGTTALLLSVPLAPLLGALLTLAWRRPLVRAWPLLAALPAAGAVALSLAALLLLHGRGAAWQATWFENGGLAFGVGLAANGLGWLAAVLVAAVALAVLVYGAGYMRGDAARAVFFAQMGLFTGAMLALVLSTSFVLMFMAWELVGLASWLLIGFHHRERGAAGAAAQAFLLTRIGDAGFLLAWLLAFLATGSTGIERLLGMAGTLPPAFVLLLALLFFSATVGKSAQLPLSSWLPAAMVAPTPVSALLHSATMVAAGVFLMLRLYPLLAAAPAARELVFWAGLLSAAAGALLATAQSDLKRLLAWSTVSQLGEMLVAIGLGAPRAAALHLVAHALFKSALFMCAGSVDRYAGSRDLREVGGLWRALPVATACFAVAGLALAGIEPLLTDTSHDAILGAAWAAGPGRTVAVLALLVLAGAYIGRAGMLLLGGAPRPGQARAGAVDGAMRAGMVATALGTALITPLLAGVEAQLPFGPAAARAAGVHPAALAAGLLGLAAGAAGARLRGPAPLLGAWVLLLQSALDWLARGVPALAFHLAAALDAFERMLDGAARIAVRCALAIAGAGGRRGGLAGAERALDRGAAALARAGMALGDAAEATERDAFAAPGDGLAALLQAGGARLRGLQTGKLYLYTLGLFAWTLAVLAAAGLVYLS